MELDDTQQADEHEPGLLDSEKRAAELEAKFVALAGRDDGGLDQRQRRAVVEAALFDEPISSAKIGRFTLVRKLGAGGMGVVYVAYDEQLDRRVAVKLLRNTVASSEAQVRLEREAQAMARLSHPHVVTVHEVGVHDGQVFMAMEFVDGEDLRQWLTRSERDWREVLAIFRQAGEGLAAAHEAGIVHRDFKPDNVLVGKDGRVRVADFGLANSFTGPLEPADASTDSQRNRLGVLLTRPGAVVGTPAYMAPEQFRGATIDAQADQFSFCVALWEGLYGTRPFVGRTLLELSTAVEKGEVTSPPQDSAVPTWLREVMLRALAADPSARFSSMREMLDVLARDPVARRRRIMLALSVGLALLALVGGLIGLTASGLRHNARQRYWNNLTEQLLEIERERGLAQANDDASRARDTTRMNVVRSYRPKHEIVEHHDPAVAVALLREVEGDVRSGSEWISTANELLGQPLAHAVLQGHRGVIVPVLFAPDGSSLYSGSDDGEVWRWAVPSGVGELIVTHGKAVTELALSPDARLLASSAEDGSVRLWSPDSGESRELERHRLAVMSIAFSPDGRRLASASKDGTVQIHELDSGRTSVLRADGGEVYVVAFAADGTRVLTGSQDGRARVWSLSDAEGSSAQVLEGHGAPIFLARMLADGRALTASDDYTARVWQLDGEPSNTVVARHTLEITALDVHASQLATASLDGTIQVSSLDFPHTAISLPAHSDGVWSLAFSPDGAWLASGSFDHTARLTRSDGRGIPKVFLGHRQSVYDLALDPSGRWLATGSYDSTVRLWDVQRPLLATRLVGHDRAVRRVRVDAASERVLTASLDGSVRIWSARDGTALARLPGNITLFDAAFSPDGERIATGVGNGDVVLWSTTGALQHRLVGHDKPVNQVCFDHDGARVASASLDGTARIWSVETGTLLAVLRGHEGPVLGIDFDHDGAQLVTASRDGTVRVWNAASGDVEHVLRGHTGKISVLVRSPDGHTLATGSDDGSARLWSTEWAGEPLVLAGHGKEIQSISFDASGDRLLTTCADHRARIWDTRDGKLLRVWEGHSNVIWDGAFLPDDRVVTASADGTLRIWSLRGDTPPLILAGHGSNEVVGVAVIDGGRGLISGATDGTARLWQLELLISDPDQLRAELEAATNLCPSVEQRIHELGHDDKQAALGYAACLRSQGR
jgi:WD40 repeat protein/predicted Ser/Thr protein kinase